MKRLFKLVAVTLVCALTFGLTGCNAGGKSANSSSSSSQSSSSSSSSSQSSASESTLSESPVKSAKPADAENPVVTIQMASGEVIKAELYPDIAPNTVNNFISLVNKGFYDGVVFHRAVPEFMIQGGDPEGSGMGGPGYTIQGEFAYNGIKNELKHTAGVLSMARSQDPDSAGSQFFIMVGDADYLDGQYAAFGKVIEGLDVAINISEMQTNSEMLLDPPVMEKVTVETFGVEYPEPVTIAE